MKAVLLLLVFITAGCVQTGGFVEETTTTVGDLAEATTTTIPQETTTTTTTTTIITTTIPEVTTTSTTTSSTTTTVPVGLSVIVSTDKDVVVRGNPVIITTHVTSGGSPVDAEVYVIITYASGSQAENSGVTSGGIFVWEKTIGGNSKPGTFFIQSTATKDGYEGSGTASFEVVPAS